MVSPFPLIGGRLSGGGLGQQSFKAGKYTVQVVPVSISLFTVIQPLFCLTTADADESPSPVPFSADLVVKKGSYIREWTSSAIPHPVSAIRRPQTRPGVASS